MTSNDETTADEPQRIDLTQFERIGLYVAPEWAELIAELKRCYEKIDTLTGYAECTVFGALTNPKIDPTGRHLTETEMKRLRQYLSGSEFITDTLDSMSADIAEAKDEEAAHLLVQWCLNVALGHYDSIMESIELSEG